MTLQEEIREARQETERQLLELKQRKYAELLRLEEHKKKYAGEFIQWFDWQKDALEKIRVKNTTVIPAPNKIGKTCLVVNVVLSWCLGYEMWNKVEAGTEGAVKVGEKYFKGSSLGIMPPVRIRVTGEDWLHHMGETLIPEFKKWAPAGQYTTRKNSQGIEYLWHFKNGSSIEFMTHDQDLKLFESWLGHGWLADEPPKKEIYSGMSRGLFSTGGKMLLSMTPLSEAWVLDDLVLSRRPDVGVVDGLSILDNDLTYKHDLGVLQSAGFDDVGVKEYFEELLNYEGRSKDYMRKWLEARLSADAYVEAVSKLQFQRFIEDCPEGERDARIKGTFKHLAGLVLKEFRHDVNIVKTFKTPPDWPVVVLIDVHLNKPQAIGFYGWDKYDREFVVDEVFENLSPAQIADEIIRRKQTSGFRLSDAYIDPLSKGDSAFVRNREGQDAEDTFTIIERKLAPHGIRLHAASKDKDSGVRNLKGGLKGENGMPRLFIQEHCERHIYEVERWVYDEDEKPIKKDDHMMENWYRSTLVGIKYTDPGEINRQLNFSTAGVV